MVRDERKMKDDAYECFINVFTQVSEKRMYVINVCTPVCYNYF